MRYRTASPSLGIREPSGVLLTRRIQVYAHRELDAAARREVAHDLLAAAHELDELTARP